MIRFFRYTFLVLILVAANAYAEHDTYTITLDGAQANAGQGTGSQATGKFFLASGDDGTMRIWGEHDVQNVTAAHIHHAPVGENGSVVVGIENPASPIDFKFDVDQDMLDSLRTGNYYINVHSEAFPSGEIRGQIVKTTTDLYEPIPFTFFVSGWQTGNVDAPQIPLGEYSVYLGAGRDVIIVDWEHEIENATAAHIHRAPFGENGSPVFTLGTSMDESAVWFCTPENVTDLLAGNLYVNIHTAEYPNGIARGQIVQSVFDTAPALTFTFKADGAQAGAGQGTGSEAIGKFFCTLNMSGTEVSIYGEHNVENATAAHVHRGARGENGGVVFGFASGQSPIRERWILAPGDLEDLLMGNFYVNIHSQAFGGGEIRGQLVMTAVDSMQASMSEVYLDGQQAAAGAGTESVAMGLGLAYVASDSSLVYFTGVHSAANPTAAHIHRGARGENGAVIMPLNQSISNLDGVWFTTPEQAAEILSGNTYVNVHTAAFGGGEIRGQIEFEANSVEKPIGSLMPVSAELISAFPNPFNSAVKISVNMVGRGMAVLAVYDLAGREVARLQDDMLEVGSHSFVWNAEGMPTGVYIAKFEAAGKTNTMKLVLTK